MTGDWICPNCKTKRYGWGNNASTCSRCQTKMVRWYFLEGLAGLVERHRSRTTGEVYSIYHAEQASLDPAGGPFVTLCEKHGTLCNHQSLTMARWHLPTGDWCEECQKTVRPV